MSNQEVFASLHLNSIQEVGPARFQALINVFGSAQEALAAGIDHWAGVAWYGAPPPPDTPVQLYEWDGQRLVLAADGMQLGTLKATLNPLRRGLVRATVSAEAGKIDLSYLVPDDLAGA